MYMAGAWEEQNQTLHCPVGPVSNTCTNLLVYTIPPCPQVARANFNEDPYVQDFGISIDQKMVTVTGRILPPPLLQYGGKVGKQV